MKQKQEVRQEGLPVLQALSSLWPEPRALNTFLSQSAACLSAEPSSHVWTCSL